MDVTKTVARTSVNMATESHRYDQDGGYDGSKYAFHGVTARGRRITQWLRKSERKSLPKPVIALYRSLSANRTSRRLRGIESVGFEGSYLILAGWPAASLVEANLALEAGDVLARCGRWTPENGVAVGDELARAQVCEGLRTRAEEALTFFFREARERWATSSTT